MEYILLSLLLLSLYINYIFYKKNDKCLKLLSQFNSVSVSHVLRAFNKNADSLSDRCIILEEDIEQFYL